MTILKYLIESKVGASADIIRLKTEDPKGFDTLKAWAEEEMKKNGIEVTEK